MVIKVLRMVRRRGRGGRSPTVFIITFYKTQKRALERRLKEEYGEQYESVAAAVVTVDSVQGSEADVVILSTVRSQSSKGDLGSFMRDERRLCVAFSRAWELSVVVGNGREMMDKGGRLWKSLVQAYAPMQAP